MKQHLLLFLLLPALVYANTQNDTTGRKQIRLLLDSSVRLWEKSRHDTALLVANQADQLARRNNDSLLMAKCLHNIGLVYNSKGDPAKSIFYYEQSLAILRMLGDRGDISVSLLNLGISYKEQARYDKALSCLFEAATYFEQVDDPKRLSSAYNTIGNIFRIEERYKKALYYHFQSLQLRRQIQFGEGIASSLNNIGTVYKDAGQYDSALFYLQASLKLKLGRSRPEKLANTYSQIAEIYLVKGQYKTSRKYYFDSYRLRRKAGNQAGINRSLYELGSLYLESNNLKTSSRYLLECASRAERAGMQDLLLKCYDRLKQVYRRQRYDSRALYYADKYIELNDSLLGEQKQRSLAQMEVKYETEKKQYEIQDLSRENDKQVAIFEAQQMELKAKSSHNRTLVIGFASLVLVLVFLSILFRNKSHFARKLDMAMRELHHRVMNNFQRLLSLSRLQLEHVKEEAARKVVLNNNSRITAMMLIHRELYFDQDASKVNMSKYIQNLLGNLLTAYDMGKVRLDIVSRIDPRIELNADKAISLGLLINELVTNAFKYAFGEDNKDPRLEISLEKNAMRMYRLVISDNGPGIPSDEAKKSLGLKLAESQVRQLKGTMSVMYRPGLAYEIYFK